MAPPTSNAGKSGGGPPQSKTLARWPKASKPREVATTQIYTHVMQKPGMGVSSPLHVK